jgi:hypothetical protein
MFPGFLSLATPAFSPVQFLPHLRLPLSTQNPEAVALKTLWAGTAKVSLPPFSEADIILKAIDGSILHVV